MIESLITTAIAAKQAWNLTAFEAPGWLVGMWLFVIGAPLIPVAIVVISRLFEKKLWWLK